MSKKGKIILWSIILVMVAAVAIILITMSLNGGAREISRSKFRTYLDNAQYVTKEGKLRDGVDVDKLPEGYMLNAQGYVVTKNEKTGEEERLIVIWKVNTDAYQYSGTVYEGFGDSQREVRRYICYGPSLYGSDAWDSEAIRDRKSVV